MLLLLIFAQGVPCRRALFSSGASALKVRPYDGILHDHYNHYLDTVVPEGRRRGDDQQFGRLVEFRTGNLGEQPVHGRFHTAVAPRYSISLQTFDIALVRAIVTYSITP